MDTGRPLIICDVDEVILSFLGSLDRWLAERELLLVRDSYALAGNLRDQTGQAVSNDAFRALMHDFLAECAHDFPPLPGALAGLEALRPHCTIIFLTNIPLSTATARRQNLDALGLRDGLIINEGPKGPALSRISASVSAPVIFIDDSPTNVTSALNEAPHITTIHMVPDEGFRAHVEIHEDVGLFTGDWDETTRYILAQITSPNAR